VTVLVPNPDQVPPRWGALANGLTLAGLGLLAFGVVNGVRATDSEGQKVAAAVLLAAAAVAWVAWVLVRNSSPEAAVATCLVVVAGAGGALAAFSPIALVFPGVATLAAASRWTVVPAAAVGGVGALAVLVATAANGNNFAVVSGGLAAVFTGILVGLTRRQAVEHAEQLTRLELMSERTEVERTRAELLAERNHLAREVHDVLAHTLAALSLQLEAFATVVDAEPATSPAIRQQLERTRELVHAGLDEARGAVRALRDDATTLAERLATLADQHGAAFRVSGPVHPLSPETVLALYRVAQEALTNVRKHATGASAGMELAFESDCVQLRIQNDLSSADGPGTDVLDTSGGGFGLRGISERVALLGGEVEAGPVGGGWQVITRVPALGAAPDAPTHSKDPLAS
jgi:signal transduction histidine kinase